MNYVIQKTVDGRFNYYLSYPQNLQYNRDNIRALQYTWEGLITNAHIYDGRTSEALLVIGYLEIKEHIDLELIKL